jgi:hypothetical protein
VTFSHAAGLHIIYRADVAQQKRAKKVLLAQHYFLRAQAGDTAANTLLQQSVWWVRSMGCSTTCCIAQPKCRFEQIDGVFIAEQVVIRRKTGNTHSLRATDWLHTPSIPAKGLQPSEMMPFWGLHATLGCNSLPLRFGLGATREEICPVCGIGHCCAVCDNRSDGWRDR